MHGQDLTHHRNVAGDNESPVCGAESGATVVDPDKVTCPTCRVLMANRFDERNGAERRREEYDLEAQLLASIRGKRP